ncbi:MAG: glycosyltransferase [Phycisphaerae bacterium]|nr:glycosyltransferase [Phycisphaerae bacterium]
MRILHVIHWLNPADGGPPMVCTRLAAAQAGLGHAVAILAYSTPGQDDRIEASIRALPGGDRVRLEILPACGRVERLWPRRGCRALRRLVPGFDVVHLHQTWFRLLVAAGREAARAGKPYCLSPHGTLTAWGLGRKAFKKRAALALGFRSLFERAAFMHVLNPYEREGILATGLNSRCQLIPNGVFLEEIDPTPGPDAFRAAHPGLQQDPYVLFLSRLHPGKGGRLLVEALGLLRSRHPTLRLVFAGPDAGARAHWMETARALGVGDRVHFVGPLWGRDKVAALVGAACYGLPSEHEGFSMAIAEALACGTCVVITPECNFPQVLEAGAGLVVVRTADAVSAAIDRIVSDPKEGAAMGARGRALIEGGFTWPRIAERMVSAYRGPDGVSQA